MKRLLLFVIALTSALPAIVGAENDQIPAERKTVWTPNVVGGVGVIGGIDQYRAGGAAGRGATPALVFDVEAEYGGSIQAAINASTTNSVILLGATTYVGGWVLDDTKPNRTIRGQGKDVDGNYLTKIDATGISGLAVTGGSTGWQWNEPASGNTITAGLTKGSTEITVASTASFVVGKLARICWSNITDEAELEAGATLAISPFGFPDMRAQMVRITAKTATTITFTPGIHHVPAASTTARVNQLGTLVEGVGIEDLEIIGNVPANAMMIGVLFEQAYNCWLFNVSSKATKNFHVSLARVLNLEIRECVLDGRLGAGTSGAGILTDHAGNCLIEDNQVMRVVPCTEINFRSTGNVIAYNLFEDTLLVGYVGAIGGAMNINHGPHNDHNLYEGNVTPNTQADGYHGSSSEDTLFRNYIHAGVYGTPYQSFILGFNRFVWKNSVVGNVLGNIAWPYGSTPYSFGNPNIGNSSFEGESNIPEGDYPLDWKMTAQVTSRVSDYEGIVTLISGSARYQGGANSQPGQQDMNFGFGVAQIMGINSLGGVKSVPPGVAGDTVYLATERVWFTSATKNSSGDLVGTWAAPQQLSSLGPDSVQHQLQAEFSVNGSTGWSYVWATGDLYMRTRADAGAYSSAILIAGETTGGGNYTDYRFSNAYSADIYNNTPTGNTPADWTDTPTLHTTNWPAQDTIFSIHAGKLGYQDKDLAVEASTILKGNTIMFAAGGPAIPAGESLGSDTLPASLFRTSKPAYFGSLNWPAFGPGQNNPGYTDIPAGARFLEAIPPILNTASIGASGTALTLSFSKPVTIGSGGSGGWTVTFPTATLTHASGDGTNTHVYTISRPITDVSVGTLSYSHPNNGLEDSNGNDVAAITNRTIYNFSTYTGGAVWYGYTLAEATGTHVFPSAGYALQQPIVIDQPGNIVAVRAYISAFTNSFPSKMGVTDTSGVWLTQGTGTISESGNYFNVFPTEIHVEAGTYWAIYAANTNSEPTLAVLGSQPANSTKFDVSQTYANIGTVPFVPEASGFAHKYIFGILLVPDAPPVPTYTVGRLRFMRR